MKNIYVKTIACLVFLLGAKAQAQTVSGLVTSDDGPLPGATIVIKGTNNGATADFDGNFSINASEDDILVVSFVGFASQEVAVNGQDQITVYLQTDNELEEVVVTGYGSQRKKEITSAVAVVGEEQFNKGTINTATELLQGKVAGLSIYNRGGNPNGTPVIRLRGLSSIGSNVQPLIVIDGIVGGSLENLDPNDIESINVLKDGSAVLDYATDDDEIPLNFTPEINELEPNSLREAGARLGKFSFKQFGRPDMDNDFPIVRLGEMYLTRAEAMARHNNDWSLALADTNIIRARAGVAAYTSLTADEFLAERGREMFQESSRRTDLIRFGKYNDTWWEKPLSEPHKNVMPIPFEQIQASNGSLTQNEGY